MDRYILNIIPRIKQFSQELNKKEKFIETNWVLYDNSKDIIEFTFLRNGTLIRSLNGNANIGKWQLLPGNKILIEYDKSAYTLENLFLNEALFILNKNGDSNSGFIFYNEKLLIKADLKFYLKSLENKLISSYQSGSYVKADTSEYNDASLYLILFVVLMVIFVMIFISSN